MAEDALQDACLQAVEKWPVKGVPDNKAAWLFTVARRRLIDSIRKNSHRNSLQTQQALFDLYRNHDSSCEMDEDIPDERLRLIFSCCHPALAPKAQVALTLKILCGLTTNEIARAYLTSQAAMDQRITRAKRKIRDAGIRYSVPEGEALKARLPSVLSTIYLIYNESYSAYSGQTLTREDLANEAIRLARVLYALLPHTDIAGLLALMILHDARRRARNSASQAYIPLEFQDRSLWDKPKIREGTNLVLASLAVGTPNRYLIEAAISALHANSPTWEKTDWAQIEQLYAQLLRHNPSPIVALNLYTAQAFKGDVKTAYDSMKKLESELQDYQPFYAAKAELASMLNYYDESQFSLNKAIDLTNNQAEKQFLIAKRDKLRKNR